MNFIQNLTLKARLVVLVLLFTVLMLLIGGLGLLGMRDAKDALNTVYQDRLIPTGQISEIKVLVQESRAQLLMAMQHDPAGLSSEWHRHSQQLHLDEVERALEKSATLWSQFMATYLTEEEKRLADEFARQREQLVSQGLRPAMQALNAQDYRLAAEILEERLAPAFVTASKASDQLLALQLDVARKEFAAAEAEYASTLTISLVAIAMAISFSSLLAWMTIAGIGRAVRALERAASEMAQGNLTVAVDYRVTSWAASRRHSTRCVSASTAWSVSSAVPSPNWRRLRRRPRR